jgi:hypothetical protein
MTTKKCIRCGEEKPLSEYHKSGVDAYGNSTFKSRCKDCVRIENKYYRANNKEALKEKRQELRAMKKVDLGVLMREAAQMANQAFPLLSPAYWNTGANKRVCEELGLK